MIDIWDALILGGVVILGVAIYGAMGWYALAGYVGALICMVGLFGAWREDS